MNQTFTLVWHDAKTDLPTKRGQYLVAYHPSLWDDVEYETTLVGIDTLVAIRSPGDNKSWAHHPYRQIIAWAKKPEPPTFEEEIMYVDQGK